MDLYLYHEPLCPQVMVIVPLNLMTSMIITMNLIDVGEGEITD
jgi:hypothetical protein